MNLPYARRKISQKFTFDTKNYEEFYRRAYMLCDHSKNAYKNKNPSPNWDFSEIVLENRNFEKFIPKNKLFELSILEK